MLALSNNVKNDQEVHFGWYTVKGAVLSNEGCLSETPQETDYKLCTQASFSADSVLGICVFRQEWICGHPPPGCQGNASSTRLLPAPDC